jgi:hypothetical protein
MFNELLEDLPENRHAPIKRYRQRLVEEAGAELTGEYRRMALTGDRQGIGGSRETSVLGY